MFFDTTILKKSIYPKMGVSDVFKAAVYIHAGIRFARKMCVPIRVRRNFFGLKRKKRKNSEIIFALLRKKHGFSLFSL